MLSRVYVIDWHCYPVVLGTHVGFERSPKCKVSIPTLDPMARYPRLTCFSYCQLTSFSWYTCIANILTIASKESSYLQYVEALYSSELFGTS